jgi:hypothetical protein
MLKDVIKVSLLQKGQTERIKNTVSVFYRIQFSLNNCELDAIIMMISSQDHNTSASKTVERRTDRIRLPESGLRLVVGLILKQRHMTARLAWVRARRHRRLHTWPHIMFSDESRFSLRLCDGRYRVYRKRGKRFTDQCVYEFDRFGGGSVMVLAGNRHDYRIQLTIVQGKLNAVQYRDGILDPLGLPFLQQRNFDNVFQHDNARCHVARVFQDFLNNRWIKVCVMLLHSCTSASRSSSSVSGGM